MIETFGRNCKKMKEVRKNGKCSVINQDVRITREKSI